MTERHNPTQSLLQACEHCDAHRTAGAKFCPDCGHDLKIEASVKSSPTLVEATSAAQMDATAPVQASSARPVVQQETGTAIAPPVPQTQPLLIASPETEPPADSTPLCCPTCGVTQPEEDMEPVCCITQVGAGGVKIPLPLDGECVVGTDEECDVSIPGDSYLSRRHARLRNDGGLIFVDDLGSSNGTLLRIRRPIVIEPGDEILVGTSVLRLDQHG